MEDRSDGVVDAWGVPVLKMHSILGQQLGIGWTQRRRARSRAAGANRLDWGLTLRPVASSMNWAPRIGGIKNISSEQIQQMQKSATCLLPTAAFMASANHNPTLTILALTVRACNT